MDATNVSSWKSCDRDMEMVDGLSSSSTQWRCIHEECSRKSSCALYFADYTPYTCGWIKFFKAFPCGDNCYHWKLKDESCGN